MTSTSSMQSDSILAPADVDTFSRTDSVVLPGEEVGISQAGTVTRIGNGLRHKHSSVIATKAGILRYSRATKTYYIENRQKHYIPMADDCVIGIVLATRGDMVKVDIGHYSEASLSVFAFEGATKKNRLNLEVGSLIYGRLINSHLAEPELSCLSTRGRGEIFGPLVGGLLEHCSLGLARDCLAENSPVLLSLGNYFPYEVAIGTNGRIWVRANTPSATIIIMNAILNSENVPPSQVELMMFGIRLDPPRVRYSLF